jgi:hypothetical protein
MMASQKAKSLVKRKEMEIKLLQKISLQVNKIIERKEKAENEKILSDL